MRMKTSELTGAALDWAVAKSNQAAGLVKSDPMLDCMSYFTPTSNWAQGGPIIEREKISTTYYGTWLAAGEVDTTGEARGYYGPTPLLAAMRCYVSSKLGDEIEIPEELK